MGREEIIMLFFIVVGSIGCLYILQFDWKRYGLIFIISLVSANIICHIFTAVGFYSFPNNVFHGNSPIPYGLVSTVFPSIALFGIRYSPEKWIWKIPFYWGIVHLGVLGEMVLKYSSIFKFNPEWDLWDSYTIWWIYYLLFELLGGKVIPSYIRNPLESESFRYGGWAWIVFHIIVISTIFLAGVYVGITVIK